MGISLHINHDSFSIGTTSFFQSFFSTISFHLEPAGWGSRFPVLMNEFYSGGVDCVSLLAFAKELQIARKELQKFSPNDVIWDIEDLSKRPPWGNQIASTITSLANYFVTDVGEDIFDVLFRAIEVAQRKKKAIQIQ